MILTVSGNRLLLAEGGVHAVAGDGLPYFDHIQAIEAEVRDQEHERLRLGLADIPETVLITNERGDLLKRQMTAFEYRAAVWALVEDRP